VSEQPILGVLPGVDRDVLHQLHLLRPPVLLEHPKRKLLVEEGDGFVHKEFGVEIEYGQLAVPGAVKHSELEEGVGLGEQVHAPHVEHVAHPERVDAVEGGVQRIRLDQEHLEFHHALVAVELGPPALQVHLPVSAFNQRQIHHRKCFRGLLKRLYDTEQVEFVTQNKVV